MDAAAYDFARTLHQQQVLIETAGLFWLLAELVILFAIVLGRQHLSNSPRELKVQWTPQITKRAIIWGSLFAALILITYGRHTFLLPVYELLQSQDSSHTLETLTATLRHRNQTHLVLWSFFITAWVFLETLIVYHGWCGYRSLRKLIDHA